MRSIIKSSASLFVAIGGVIVLGAGLFALKEGALIALGQYGPYSSNFSFLVALAALASGASIVLIGGTAYLLSNIDERLEEAMRTAKSDEA